MRENIVIRRMKQGDADICFDTMNTAFNYGKETPKDFRDQYPKMTIDDDVHMNKHFGLYRDDKLCAVIGVYPLPLKVGDIKLMASTVGNVGTLPEECGKGYMTKLLDEAMNELDRIGADMSRLGGKRERYNRYGYETCGTNMLYKLSPDQAAVYADNAIEFAMVSREDTDLLHKIKTLFYKNKIAVDRGDDNDFYLSLTAYQCQPWAAIDKDGNFIGYISVKDHWLAESAAVSDEMLRDILCTWCVRYGKEIAFWLALWQAKAISIIEPICCYRETSAPCHFFIRNWDKVCDAFVKLKVSYTHMPDAECIIGIEGWGNLRFYVQGGSASAEKTDKKASVVLGQLDATRYIFGPNPHTDEGPDAPGAAAFFPLPLSWNLQDRV